MSKAPFDYRTFPAIVGTPHANRTEEGLRISALFRYLNQDEMRTLAETGRREGGAKVYRFTCSISGNRVEGPLWMLIHTGEAVHFRGHTPHSAGILMRRMTSGSPVPRKVEEVHLRNNQIKRYRILGLKHPSEETRVHVHSAVQGKEEVPEDSGGA